MTVHSNRQPSLQHTPHHPNTPTAAGQVRPLRFPPPSMPPCCPHANKHGSSSCPTSRPCLGSCLAPGPRPPPTSLFPPLLLRPLSSSSCTTSRPSGDSLGPTPPPFCCPPSWHLPRYVSPSKHGPEARHKTQATSKHADTTYFAALYERDTSIPRTTRIELTGLGMWMTVDTCLRCPCRQCE